MLACISGCRGVLVAKSPRAGSYARKSSPSTRKMAQNGRFMARWANFFAEMPLEGPRWANFFAEKPTAALKMYYVQTCELIVASGKAPYPRARLVRRTWVEK